MMKYQDLISKYYDQYSLVESNLKSFNDFMDKGMQDVIQEMQDVVPTIIPAEVKEFKIKLGKMSVTKPLIIEADGSRRDIYPFEARLRKLTYAAPINLQVSATVDGIERESFTTLIGKIPIMLRSKYCHLNGLQKDSLLENYEDPGDPGGYFILNGNERVLITVEDLAPNKFFISKNKIGPSKYKATVFSERASYRIPHTIEQMRNGIFYLTFTRFQRIAITSIIKCLGLVTDQEITRAISEEQFDDIFINLYETIDLKTQDQAIDYVAKKIGLGLLPDHEKREKIFDLLDKYLLPHLGERKENRLDKAYNLCKYLKSFLKVKEGGAPLKDKDHYANKRLKLSGDLLTDLFRVNLRSLIQDMLYNFQRLVKRGKFQSIRIIIRDQLLTSRLKSALATGVWVGGRKGVSQNIDRTNYLASVSHLQRIVSLLSAAQENFSARALHPTHIGKLCPVETPEGTPIGLRKNPALLARITQENLSEDKLRKSLEGYGVKSNG